MPSKVDGGAQLLNRLHGPRQVFKGALEDARRWSDARRPDRGLKPRCAPPVSQFHVRFQFGFKSPVSLITWRAGLYPAKCWRPPAHDVQMILQL